MLNLFIGWWVVRVACSFRCEAIWGGEVPLLLVYLELEKQKKPVILLYSVYEEVIYEHNNYATNWW